MNNIPILRTPNPNIGSCNNKGKWSDSKQIEECKSCISKSTKEYPYFYCDGKCSSEFEIGGGCALNELVAKNEEQCVNPCHQVGLPSDQGGLHGCTDDFDCDKNEKCENNTCVLKNTQQKEKNIIEIINNCSSTDNWKICLSDINKLNCKDIKDLIKLNVETSKKEGVYESERKKIIDAFKEINDNSKIVDNTYNIINNTITNINCAISEIDNLYNLKDNEKIQLLNIPDAKAHYVSHILNTDKKVKKSLSNILNDVKNDSPNKGYDIKYILIIIFIIIIIVILTYFILHKKTTNISLTPNYLIPNYII